MGRRSGVVLMFLMAMAASVNLQQCRGELSADEKAKCQTEVTKLTNCLPYAQKQSSAPTAQCCTDVAGVRSRNAACLCYLLSLAASGSGGDQDPVKALNLDSTRLVQLPTACKLQNTSISLCPALLGIPPNSPAAAIFLGNGTKTSRGVTTPPTTAGGRTTSPTPTSVANHMHHPSFNTHVICAVLTALVLSMFATWP